MKNAKIGLIVLVGLVLCSAAILQKPDYKKEAETFLTGVLKGDVDKSYDELFADTVIAPKKQAIQLVKEQTRTMFRMYGEAIDYEFIKQQKYGDSIVRVVYIVKCGQLPVTYEFYFYKPVSDWKLINISVNDQYDLLADK